MRRLLPAAVAGALALGAHVALAETPVERGEYLVRGPMACGNCHTPRGPDGAPDMGRELAGTLVEDVAPFTAYGANITPAGAVGGWTDAELARAIREGIRPDGSLIGPPMPFASYRHLADDDVAAIVAFLRTLAPVENAVPASTYRIPLPPEWGPPVASVAAPAPGVTREHGEYVARAAHCMECHTPITPEGQDLVADLGRGGNVWEGPWGVSVAENLTHHADGLAGYDDAEIKAMIVEGRRPDGTPMAPPMPYAHYARMSAQDLDALVLYLRSLPGKPDF